MRADVIRLYKSVHTWTGIVAGMALFIAFYAGALTMFKEPLARWVAPPAATHFVPLAEVPALISRTLATYPSAARSFELNLEQTESEPARLSWRERKPGADDHNALSSMHYAATLSVNGEAQVEQTHPSQLVDLIDILHRVVGLPFDNDYNRWIMGAISALYALALVSGVVLLFPTLVKDFFALRLGRNLKRMWLDAHNVVGIISLPFHVVMAITAVVFAYHDGIYLLQDKLIHDGKLSTAWSAGRSGAKPGVSHDPATMLPPQALLKQVKAFAPTFDPVRMEYMQVTGPRAVVRIWGHDAMAISPRAVGGFMAIDPYSGKVMNKDFLPGKQDAANLTISSFFALHFATFGGTPVRWMYFLLALAGAWLFYSGNLLWIESRRKAQRKGESLPVQRLDTRLLAAGTVGVCLGCVNGISLSIVSGKWLHGHVADLNAWHWYVYYGVFFASIAWSFIRGGARASVDLLWLAVAATLAIPLTSLLGAMLPALGWWANTSSAALGVDLTAAVSSLGFAWMACATRRRVVSGVADSVWSSAGASRSAV